MTLTGEAPLIDDRGRSLGSVDPTTSFFFNNRSKSMSTKEKEHNNELTIRTETEDQTQQILDVLTEAEENGELDFGFTCIRNTYPR
jgi:hypothetical protein